MTHELPLVEALGAERQPVDPDPRPLQLRIIDGARASVDLNHVAGAKVALAEAEAVLTEAIERQAATRADLEKARATLPALLQQAIVTGGFDTAAVVAANDELRAAEIVTIFADSAALGAGRAVAAARRKLDGALHAAAKAVLHHARAAGEAASAKIDASKIEADPKTRDALIAAAKVHLFGQEELLRLGENHQLPLPSNKLLAGAEWGNLCVSQRAQASLWRRPLVMEDQANAV